MELRTIATYARTIRPVLPPDAFAPATSRVLWLPFHAAVIATIAWALAAGHVPAPLWPVASIVIGCCLAGVTFLASLLFFLTTNFGSWLGQSLPYDRGPAGLLESYWMALPFWRGTLVSDLVFSGALFGLHAALSRAFVPAPVPVEHTPRG